MAALTDSQIAEAHRLFAADCFNRAWDYIDRPERSAADDEQMLLLSFASLWHWTQRPDGTNRNLSIGYWQVSRVYALMGQPGNALHFAEKCLAASTDLNPFFRAYAHEAMARAASIAGNGPLLNEHASAARALAAAVADPGERAMLENDLASLRCG